METQKQNNRASEHSINLVNFLRHQRQNDEGHFLRLSLLRERFYVLLKQLHQDFEHHKVTTLSSLLDQAHYVYTRRRENTHQCLQHLPADVLKEVHRHNQSKYQDVMGPSFEYLLKKYKGDLHTLIHNGLYNTNLAINASLTIDDTKDILNVNHQLDSKTDTKDMSSQQVVGSGSVREHLDLVIKHDIVPESKTTTHFENSNRKMSSSRTITFSTTEMTQYVWKWFTTNRTNAHLIYLLFILFILCHGSILLVNYYFRQLINAYSSSLYEFIYTNQLNATSTTQPDNQWYSVQRIDYNSLYQPFVIWFIIFIWSILIERVTDWFQGTIKPLIAINLESILMKKLWNISPFALQKLRSKNLGYRVVVAAVFFVDHLFSLLSITSQTFVWTVGSTVLLLTYSPVYGIFVWTCLLYTISIILVNIRSSERKTLFMTILQVKNEIKTLIYDRIQNHFLMTVYTAQEEELQSLQHLEDKYNVYSQKENNHYQKLYLWIDGINLVAILFCIGWSFYEIQQEQMPIGNFVLVYSIFLQLFRTLHVLTEKVISSFSTFCEIGETISLVYSGYENNVILEGSDIKHKTISSSCKITKDNVIMFQNVTFGFSPEKLIFSNLSVTIPQGQKVGIVGSSGSGKQHF